MNLRRADGVGDVGHDLEGHPEPGVARQLEAQASEVEDVLHVAGEEHRHLEIVEGDLGMSGQGRGLRLRIVAGQRQHAAVPPDTREVRVTEDVAAPVDAGSLAVPHSQHAVVTRASVQVGKLAPQHRGGAQVLVHSRDEDDLMLGQEFAVTLDRLVEPAERRSPVSRDQRRGVEPAAAIRAMLVQREANEGLDARHEDTAGLEAILPLERKGVGRLHCRFHVHAAATSEVWRRRLGQSPETRKGPVGPSPLSAPRSVVARLSGSRTRPGRNRTRRRSPRSTRSRIPGRS
jgi:hypothetical protein